MTHSKPPLPSHSPETETIGQAGKEVLALTFAGGAFETAMQLGVAHALLVSGSQAPDIVVGIAAGAPNAAALAEILQAGDELDHNARRQARFRAFRQFLNAYQEAPSELIDNLLPDPYEINAGRPLRLMKLPSHYEEERAFRERALQSHSGLIRLYNDLLEVDLPISLLTQAIQRILGLAEAPEKPPGLRRWWAYCRESFGLLFLLGRRFLKASPTFGKLARALIFKPTPSPSSKTARQIIQRWKIARFPKSVLRRIADVAITSLFLLLGAPFLTLISLALLLTIPLQGLWKSTLANRPTIKEKVKPFLHSIKARLLKIRRHITRTASSRWLERYGLKNSLLDSYALRQLFVRLFDPTYYGKHEIEGIIDAALQRPKRKTLSTGLTGIPQEHLTHKRRLRSFHKERSPQIFVAPVAADIATGRLMAIPQDEPVVDALLAATAFTPLFPAVRLNTRDRTETPPVCIDGVNIQNEPTSALVDLLRKQIHEDAQPLRIFQVSSIPLSAGSLHGIRKEYMGLVQVVTRVLQLRRFRDAGQERKLTQLYSALLPLDKARKRFPDLKSPPKDFIQGTVHSIEPESPLSLNEKILQTSDRIERRRMINETVADGCRATLQAILRPSVEKASIGDHATATAQGKHGVLCADALSLHMKGTHLINWSTGPGVQEVCQACAVARGTFHQKDRSLVLKDISKKDRELGIHNWSWPLEHPPAEQAPVTTAYITEPTTPVVPVPHHPEEEPSKGPPPPTGPSINLLFSGGVFRGVFQVGVLVGLNELSVQPHLIAGASVGSIVGAIAADLFTSPIGERPRKIALLCSTFLGLDKLMLTDRLSDFVRRLTLHAADTDLSLRDIDLFFRRFDSDPSSKFGRRARRVTAGLERLFYTSPFELLEMARAFRSGDAAKFLRLTVEALEEFLDYHEVGHEFLGTEPLSLLIRDHVLSGKLHKDADSAAFNIFQTKSLPIDLVAVATNLTLGRLERLPSSPDPDLAKNPYLLESLLASSAFPAIFRPRWSWEILKTTIEEDRQYVDGGVMDNLPLDTVIQFMKEKLDDNRLARRPAFNGRSVPHLLFSASLEPEIQPISNQAAADLAENWIDLYKRARQLGYNRKIDGFAAAQKNFRKIFEQSTDPQTLRFHPIDIEILTVRPKWVCSTFGFHPMLGFRRERQAANMAHGCAMTLATLGTLPDDVWAKAWNIDSHDLDRDTITLPPVEASDRVDQGIKGHPVVELSPARKRRHGVCWFRKTTPCPFSLESLDREDDHIRGKLSVTLKRELHNIYLACGRPETHSVLGEVPA